MKICQVAVLIPSYKPGEYLNKCLKSLEEQTLQKDHFKVYVALNGPKGNYEKYIQELLNKYTFKSEYCYTDQAGVSNARNMLLDISCEPFIAFIDDDDVVSKSYLEELLSVTDDYFIGVSNSYTFNVGVKNLEDNFIGISFASLNNIETSIFKIRKFFSPPWAKLISRKNIMDVRFDTNISIGEDSLFMARISPNVKGIKKVADYKACYYVNNRLGSATRKRLDRISEFRRVFYLLRQYSIMLFDVKYNKLFILTRIVATLKHHLLKF